MRYLLTRELCAYELTECEGRKKGRTVLFQTDWDYPGLASRFGYVACSCGATDGTVDCPHRKAGAMIERAGNFLDRRCGRKFNASGRIGSQLAEYFQGEE